MSLTNIILAGVALTVLALLGLFIRRGWLDSREERRRGLNRDTEVARLKAELKDRAARKREVLAGTHDLSCTLLFALTYLAAPMLGYEPLLAATAVYVAANALLFLVSRNFQQGMLLVAWVSRLAIVVFGGLTLWLQDETFIKMNRTAYFTVLAAWSIGSVLIGSPRLQRFGASERHKDITPQGWRAATLYAGCACALLAVVNELVWRNFSTGFWMGFQVWGWVLAELVLLPLALPLFTRHGFDHKPRKSRSAEASQ